VNKTVNFTDPALDQQIAEICRALQQPEWERFKITPEGSYAIRLTNDTGAVSVKGSIVTASRTVDNAVVLQNNEFDAFGVILEDGIPKIQQLVHVVSYLFALLLMVAPLRLQIQGTVYLLLRHTSKSWGIVPSPLLQG